MRTVKTICVAITATLLLAAAPASQAQQRQELEVMQAFLAIVTDYLEAVQTTHEISANAEKAAILQMQKIQEAFESRGEKARTAEVLREVLKDSNNPAIRNAAYVMLGDILKETGRTDDAVNALRQGLQENIEATN